MKINNIKLEFDFDSASIIINTNDKIAAARILENVGRIDPKKEYTVKIEKKKKKRSLDANGYMWVLLGKLAEKVENSPIELYKYYVRGFGQYYIIPMREDAIKAFSRIWEGKGTGWFVDDIGRCRRTAGYHNLKVYYGTSEYDTKTMSRLIAEIVLDCEDQGIETLTPREIGEILEAEKGAKV